MKKRNYEEARLRVVSLSGRLTLLSGSSPVTDGTASGAPGMTKTDYTMSGSVFQ